MLEIKNKRITFYGKVVDGAGLAVVGASVTMMVEQEIMVGKRFLIKQPRQGEYLATTDAAGAFVIKNGVGWRVILKKIEAEGYQFEPSKQPSLYFFPISHASQLKAPYFFGQTKSFRLFLF